MDETFFTQMNFYFLNINAIDYGTDEEDGILFMSFDVIPEDTVFIADGFWALSYLSDDFLNCQDYKIKFEKRTDVKYASNAIEQLASGLRKLPPFVYKLTFEGIAVKDDLGVYANAYLVVSENALAVLRNEGVLQAEADLIDAPIEEYFATNRQFFWMPEPLRTKFIEKFVKKLRP
ncbi:MAG: hypothetical protein IPN76_21245 [Saprospiraceae bacterium]|nr:hypothetical protein [Saprospiraceae bacterium]